MQSSIGGDLADTTRSDGGGTACSATDVGGNREVVRWVTGLLVQPQDPQALASAILQCSASRSEPESSGREARALVEKEFDVSRMVEDYEALYRQAAQHAGSDSSDLRAKTVWCYGDSSRRSLIKPSHRRNSVMLWCRSCSGRAARYVATGMIATRSSHLLRLRDRARRRFGPPS